jgi:alkylation response protein AidB-like acyl-CoA dehydrogenase
VRLALTGFSDAATARWEQENHIPPSAIAALGKARVFRDRWMHGAESGLPYLLVYSEELFRSSSGLAISAMGHSEMFTGALAWLGTAPAHHELLENAMDGTIVGCFAATEAHGGSSLAGVRTSSVRTQSGWHLTGAKRYITNIGGATHVLVLAREEGAAASDLSLFIVPSRAPGVRIDGFFEMVGLRACDIGQASFDVDLPDSALLGKPGLGLLYATYLLHFERVSICAQLIAAAGDALRLAVSYARSREVGGSRIIEKQAIRHRLALCQARLWNLESRIHDLAERASTTGHMPAREIAALKLTAGEDVGKIVDTCMQVFGARGSSRNFPLERIWRDARLARFGGGTDEVLADLIGSYLDRPDQVADLSLARSIASDDPVGSRAIAGAERDWRTGGG